MNQLSDTGIRQSLLTVEKPQLALDALSKLMRQFANKPEFRQLIHTLLFSLSGQLSVSSSFSIFKNPESTYSKTTFLATGKYTINKQLASLILTDDICDFFVNSSRPSHIDSIEFPENCSNYMGILNDCQVSLLSPVIHNDSLLGIIGLGSKVTGKPYGKNELSLFETVIGTVTPLIANSYQFWEVQKLGAWYFDILNNVKQGVLAFGDNFKLKKINQVGLEIIKRHRLELEDADTLLNQTLEEVFSADCFKGWGSRFIKLITDYDSYLLPNISTQSSFSTKVYDIYFKRISGDSEFASDFIITLDDVTERKEAERALELTQFSVDKAASPIIWVIKSGKLTYANEAACLQLGYNDRELLNCHTYDINSRITKGNWESVWENGVNAAEMHLDSEMVRKDGTILPVDLITNFIEFDGIEYNCVSFRDVSERKISEKREQERLERLQLQKEAITRIATSGKIGRTSMKELALNVTEMIQKTVKVTNVNIWLFKEDHKILECLDCYSSEKNTHEAGRVIEASDFPNYFEALRNERIIECSEIMEDPRVKEVGEKLLNTREITSLLDAAINISGQVVGVVCLEHKGKPRQWLGDESKFAGEVASQIAAILAEIKQREAEQHEQELKEKLERAERMEAIGVLAGGVAHDLNNMLGPLVGYPELLLRKLPENSPIRKQIEKIGKSAQNAADIIQDLLTLARRGRYVMKPLQLNEVIEEYLDSTSYSKKCEDNPEVSISCKLDTDLPNILGSTSHLSKVIMNLIVNAFDAMPEGGKLSISTRHEILSGVTGINHTVEPGNYAIVSIKDSGSGIMPEDIDRIFEPYYSKKDMGASGSGLGLAVVYGILHDHHGNYDIISKPDKGTEFCLYFPITSETMPMEDEVKESIDGRGTLLVVDDIEEQRDIAHEILSSLGYEVFTAENGRKALDFLSKKQVDIVIIDMIMEEDFDGLDTYREILKLYPDQKAIIISGFSATERVEKMLSMGAGNYIRKPFTVDTLGIAVKNEIESQI